MSYSEKTGIVYTKFFFIESIHKIFQFITF